MSSADPLINPDDVVKAWRRDPQFASISATEVAALEPYVRKLPAILAADLNKELTFDLRVKSTLAFYTYLTANPGEYKAAYSAADSSLGDVVLALLSGLIKSMSDWLPNLSERVEAAGRDERQLLISGPPALNTAALDLLLVGELTLGRLLVVQPGLLTNRQRPNRGYRRQSF